MYNISMRLVKFTGKKPAEVKTKSGESVWVCRCGLTKDERGLCDGSHAVTQDEEDGKVYVYDRQGRRVEIE